MLFRSVGPGARKWHEAARQFVEGRGQSQPILEMRAENESLKAEIATLKDMLAGMRNEIEALPKIWDAKADFNAQWAKFGKEAAEAAAALAAAGASYIYLAGRPMTAEEIAETLGHARSNVSTSLHELLSWNLIELTSVLGDRRDYYDAKRDNWEILTTIVEGRKRREIDPTIAMLRQCAADAGSDNQTPAEVKARIESMLGFVETLARWYEDMRVVPKPVLVKLMNLGAKVARKILCLRVGGQNGELIGVGPPSLLHLAFVTIQESQLRHHALEA